MNVLCAALMIGIVGVSHATAASEERTEGPLAIHRIAGFPGEPDRFYAITSNMGVFRSDDGGRRWVPSNRGLRSFTHHALTVASGADRAHPVLYLGGWGGGVSMSADSGATWSEINANLGNTAVDAIAVDPRSPDRLYVATSTRMYRSSDGGRRWEEFGRGLPAFSGAVGYKSLIVEPPPARRIWLGTEGGLFRRDGDAGRWRRDPQLGKARVTTLAYDEGRRRLYVGTLKQGLYAGTGKNWKRLGGAEWFISGVAVHPGDPRRVYVSTRGSGVYRSDDGGASWAKSTTGLTDDDVRSLAVHPDDPSRLVLGTTTSGLFYSADGGATWTASEPAASLTMGEIIAMIETDGDSQRQTRPKPDIPPAFAKCNACHGWSDLALNAKRTYWRVPPNPRDWDETVGRMAERAKLTAEERREVPRFLSAYSRRAATP
ncbi:MAG: hypothetical protein HY207_08120 [Nitrospirae bacterium]|nr:hypothetical protein [Nitrospirota bacterium]